METTPEKILEKILDGPFENIVGKIIKKIEDPNCGLVKVPKIGNVFFRETNGEQTTKFLDTNFDNLEIGDRVKLTVFKTEYGLWASELTPKPIRKKIVSNLPFSQ